MGSLDVQIETRDGCTVVRLSGDGGVANADRLRTSLIRLTALRPSLTVFDLAGVVFVASLFLGLLVGFRRDMLRVGGQVRLAALQPNVDDIVRAARLEQLFPITASVEDALTGLPV